MELVEEEEDGLKFVAKGEIDDGEEIDEVDEVE